MRLDKTVTEPYEVLMGNGTTTTSFLICHSDPMKLRKQLTDIGIKVTSIRKYNANLPVKRSRK